MRTVLSLAAFLGSALTAVGQPAPTARNLLPNASFEEASGGLPEGWRWEAGAAQAEARVDGAGARSGERCLRIENPTPASPHVFGRLVAPVRVTEGRTYTLSCYVRSAAPGTAWIGTGTGWQFRFPFPAAEAWTRVTGTFVADDAALDVMILTESVTPGLWVDDVQLEPGAAATPFVYQPPLRAGETELTVLQGEWVSVGANVVENSSFEALDGGLPRAWSFDRRNTDGALAVDETVAHSGARSIRLSNGTPFGAHVYSLLSYTGGLTLEPGRDYTVSCWVRSDDPGIAWIGGGPGWRIRTMFPRTEGSWQRVWSTFRTEADTQGFPLLIVSESPTAGVWIDDVKLELGSEPTPYLPEGGADGPQVLPNVPPQVVADATVELGAWVYTPQGADPATLSAELRSEGGEALVRASWQGRLEPGLAYAALRCGLTGAEPSDCVLRLTAEAAGVAASGTAEFRLHTVGRQRERLAQTRERAAAVRRLFDEARAQGIDAAYPRVSLTVADNFCEFVAEDLDHREVTRAARQLDELAVVLDRAEAELSALLTGRPEPLVPRYVTSPIVIAGTSFVATVRWPDGREERRPVFFTGYGHFGSVRRDLEKFPDYGLNIIQVEFGPSSTVVGENEESTAPVEEFAALLERAAASNVAVNLLLSPHYFPQWALEKWPQVGGIDGGFGRISIDAPEARSVWERHLRLVAERLKGKAALHSYCLSNEPIYVDPSADPNNASKWAAWLRTKYETLEALNAAHRAAYTAFEEVPCPAKAAERTTPLYHDWCRFNAERFSGWHQWMADVIHAQDPQAPVHAKEMNTFFWHAYTGWGVDPDQFCGFSQIAGNDSWKYYERREGDWANGWQGENMHFDLLRSCRGQPSFNSENHVIVDRDLNPVPGAHIRNVLWQAAIHGQGASTMWVWERTFDARADFAGSIMHRPDCADEHGRVALDLMRLAPEVTAFQQAPARIAVVYSVASLVYGATDSERELHRVYHALNFLGEKLDFITEPQLAEAKADRYAVIVAPGVTHLPEAALQALSRYRGLLMTTGDACLSRDDLDRPATVGRPSRTEVLSAATGRALRDELAAVLTRAGLNSALRLREAYSEETPWGVEWQTVTHNGALLANLVNYTQKPVEVRINGPQGTPSDLLTGAAPEDPLVLKPLVPVLLRFAQ